MHAFAATTVRPFIGLTLTLSLSAVSAQSPAQLSPCMGDPALDGDCTGVVVSAAATPVSPGASQAGVRIADTCPTFSWGVTAAAERYELAIYDAQWHDSGDQAEQAAMGIPLREITIAAPATAWTPAGDECLTEGEAYVWFVRPHTAAGPGRWSAGHQFEIDYDADALTETVRRELAAQLREPAVWREVIQQALSVDGGLERFPPVTAATATAALPAHSRATGDFHPGRASGEQLVSATSFPNPSALKTSGPHGVVFGAGGPGEGGIPAAGGGVRFMWYPGKRALRAGGVLADQWDDDKVGAYSVAMGDTTMASGDYSVAMGIYTQASGYGSTALGWKTTASGSESTALGYSTTASGDYSTALGGLTTASGENSTALGYWTTASGVSSTALGHNTTASGNMSTALGLLTTASGYNSMALGYLTVASGDSSNALGFGTTAQSYLETAIGRYNTLLNSGSFSPLEWKSADRLFVIGNGIATVARSDALIVQKNGNLTISGAAYKPGGGSWLSTSDVRLKDVTGPYTSGLDAIAALQPVRFHYKPDNARNHDSEPEYVGFIAQQAQAVIPEAVSEGLDGYLDFDMHAVNVALVNAVKELKTQSEAQQAQLQSQQGRIAALEAQLEALLPQQLTASYTASNAVRD